MKKFKKTDKFKTPSVKKSLEKVVGSSEQQAIWEAVASDTSHLIVQARAGTGKTFTSIHSLFHLSANKCGKVGFVAFNRSIAEELATKIPEDYEAKTLHGLGFRLLRDAYGRVEIMRSCKTRFLLKRILGTDSIRWDTYSPVQRLVSLAKGCGAIAPDDFDDLILSDLAIEHDLELDRSRAEYLFDLVRTVLAKSDEIPTLVDFDDMIRLPLFVTPKFKYDVLFVDEAQDLNKSQQQLATRVAKRLVLVGDDRQSIYGFRGADTSSLPNMEKLLDCTSLGCKVLPLTESRRCPRLHVLLAQNLVPDFRYLPDAPQGEILSVDPSRVADVAQPGDLIVSRVNAPLVRLAYSFLQRNIRCRIQGRDFSKNLISLIQNLCRNVETDIPTFLDALENYRDHESILLSETPSPRSAQQLETLNDKCDCLVALCENKPQDFTSQSLIALIESLFTDEQASLEKKTWNCVLLSSVHRAKGLEARNVFVLTGKMPIPFAKSEAAIEQEMNIIYVAITRSLQNLYFVGMLPPCLSLPAGYKWQTETSPGPVLARVISLPLVDEDQNEQSQGKETRSHSQEVGQDSDERSAKEERASSQANRKRNLHGLPKAKGRTSAKQDAVQSVPSQARQVHERASSSTAKNRQGSASKNGKKGSRKSSRG